MFLNDISEKIPFLTIFAIPHLPHMSTQNHLPTPFLGEYTPRKPKKSLESREPTAPPGPESRASSEGPGGSFGGRDSSPDQPRGISEQPSEAARAHSEQPSTARPPRRVKADVHTRHCVLYEFQLGHNVVEATQNLKKALGEDCISQRLVQQWFNRFAGGNLKIESKKKIKKKPKVKKEKENKENEKQEKKGKQKKEKKGKVRKPLKVKLAKKPKKMRRQVDSDEEDIDSFVSSENEGEPEEATPAPVVTPTKKYETRNRSVRVSYEDKYDSEDLE